MGRKQRAIGLFVSIAACLIAAMPGAATAETGGHFTSEVEHTSLDGSESGSHRTEFKDESSNTYKCDQVSYTGTMNATTVTEIQLTPSYSECKTTSDGTAVSIHANGCKYILTIGKNTNGDNTVDLSCPIGKALEITHPTCRITVPAQTLGGGLAYTKVTESGKTALTVDATLAQVTAHYHAGSCIFIGTTHKFNLTGSFTLVGFNTQVERVGIKATGPENREFQTESSHTAVTGSGSSITTFGALITVECTTASQAGTIAGSSAAELTVSPSYSGCKGTGREVTTDMNGCAYVLGLTGVGADGKVTIECPAGKSIQTTVDKFPEGCTITIPAQAPGGVVDYKEEGAGTGRDLLLTWTLEGMHYTRDGCEIGGTGINGTMSGSITLSGEDTSGNPKGIWIE
jgi:hypothetical protein